MRTIIALLWLKILFLLLLLMVQILALVAPAAAQEKTWKIPVIGGTFKVQSPIPLSSSPRVGTVYSPNSSSVQGESTTNAAARRGQQISERAQEGSMTSDTDDLFENEVVMIPPGKHAMPDLRGIPIAIWFPYGYSAELELEIREKIGDKKAVFVNATGLRAPCPATIRPLTCLVVHYPDQYGTRSDNNSSGSQGRESSTNGSSSSNSVMYYVLVTAQLLRWGHPKPSLLGSAEKKFNVPIAVSEHYANSGPHYWGYGGSSANYDLEKVMLGKAADAAKNALKNLLDEKDRWRPAAQIQVREAFGAHEGGH